MFLLLFKALLHPWGEPKLASSQPVLVGGRLILILILTLILPLIFDFYLFPIWADGLKN